MAAVTQLDRVATTTAGNKSTATAAVTARVRLAVVTAMLLALIAAPVAAHHPHRLTYQVSCLSADGHFSVMFIGKGTVNQPIDWSPDRHFRISGLEQPWMDNHLEGDSGTLGFWIKPPPFANSGVTILYPRGVWARWSRYPHLVTHVPVPKRCDLPGAP
jgi:hypothetical protein